MKSKNKEEEIKGNICCEGCYRLGIKQGEKQAMNKNDKLLFEAFKAGFKQTGEGFNAEYCNRFGTFDGAEPFLTKLVKPLFEGWKKQIISPAKEEKK